MWGENFNLIETCNQKIQSDLSCSYKGLEKLLMSLCLNICPFFFFFFFPMKISSTLLPHQCCSVILGRGGGGGDLARSHARTRETHFLNYLKEVIWSETFPRKEERDPLSKFQIQKEPYYRQPYTARLLHHSTHPLKPRGDKFHISALYKVTLSSIPCIN